MRTMKLDIRNFSKTCPNVVKAMQGVSLMTIGEGIVGFPGEIGAGKSTLIPGVHFSIKLIKTKRCDHAGR